MDEQPAIKLTQVSKIFDPPTGEQVIAVDKIDLEVRRGEIFGLLGPNGAGKTTTLRMISTILQPTSGHVVVDGFDTVTHSNEVRRRLGFLSGDTSLYKRLKAREMVEFFGRLYGMSEIELKLRVEELFRLLDMEGYAETMCEALSSGTKQKVNIARTMVHNPPILVFDEPTVGLDVMVARSLTDFILSLKKSGKTVIFSTHIMREAERLCDRIGMIFRGKLLFVGTLEEILRESGENNLEDAFFALAGTEEIAL